jgi:branched-chain amino acid transport system substrate-binding protein
MPRRCTRTFALVLSLLVASVLMSGCGGAGHPEALPAPSPVARAADDVVVGATVSLSGRFSGEGAIIRDGYRTWAAAANETGGLLVGGQRRRVRLVVRDDGSEPLGAVQAAEQLVREEGATFFLGPISSPSTIAVATTAERFGALTVAPDATSPSGYSRGLQMLLSVQPTEETFFYSLLELANELSPRARPIALVVPDLPFYAAAAAGAAARARDLGLEPFVVERYPPGTADLTPILDSIGRIYPRATVVGGDLTAMPSLAATVREIRIVPGLKALVPERDGGALRSNLGADAEGLVTLDWWTPASKMSGPVLGSARQFAERFEREHGYSPESRAAAAAAAGLVLQLGVERAGTTDPMAVRAALAALDVTTFWGRLAWDDAGRNRAGRLPVIQFAQGQGTVVSPADQATGRLLYPLPPTVP